MRKHKAESPITDKLKQAIVDSGLPKLTIANDTGVTRASLIRFLRGERSIRLDMADKLAAYFDLELVRKSKGEK